MSAASDVEEDVQAFYAAIGKAITQWVNVEDALFKIFERGLRLADSREAAAAFYSQVNFRAKLDMVDAVMAIRLASGAREDWARLFRRLKKRAKDRNALAHYYMVYQGKRVTDSPVLKLVPTLKPNPNRPANLADFVHGTEDIDVGRVRVIGQGFVIIANELAAFLEGKL